MEGEMGGFMVKTALHIPSVAVILSSKTLNGSENSDAFASLSSESRTHVGNLSIRSKG